MQNLDTQSILIIAALLFVINLFIFYTIIKSATKSKAILKNSTMQLKVLIEMAIVAGVPAENMEYEIRSIKQPIIDQTMKDFDNGNISKEQMTRIQTNLVEKIKLLKK